ncbi:MAG: glycosyltransferase [Muribaculaceae bacterium]|nr:glycosyltransferase [Muribaculaceae bacterium]
MSEQDRISDIDGRVRVSIVAYLTDPDELRTIVGDLHAGGLSRICLIDNSPSDNLRAISRELEADYVFMGRNAGYGAAHNVALRMSLDEPSIDYHLVINSDMRVPADTPRMIADFMDVHPEVGQLIPRIDYPDGRLQPVVRLLPAPIDVIGRRFIPGWLMKRRNRRYTLAFWDHGSEADVPYHQGSFLWLRVEALRKVGLFDERFFMYPEDIDLTRRMHREYRTLYWPVVRAVHYHRAASYRSLKMLRIHIVNMIRYFNKWGWIFDSERKRFNRRVLDRLNASAADNGKKTD